jgi:hypothetical protein
MPLWTAVSSQVGNAAKEVRRLLGLDGKDRAKARKALRGRAPPNPPEKELALAPHERKALDALDDSSQDALDTYNRAGVFLADYYSERMKEFVRAYVFGQPQAH